MKNVQLHIPEYLTIEEYQKIYSYKTDSQIEFLINTVCAFTGMDVEEVRKWSIDTLAKAANKVTEVANVTGHFCPIVEFNDTVYGYAQLDKATLGEFIDLELHSKDSVANLHRIASILYRPIVSHKFGTLKWEVKSAWKQANNKQENPLKYYTVEEYNVDTSFDREEEFKQFPAHLILGALNFFLVTMLLSLNDTLYYQEIMNMTQKMAIEESLLESLSDSTGGGLVFSTSYQKPGSFLFPGPDLSLN
jgi:hypothetical protein